MPAQNDNGLRYGDKKVTLTVWRSKNKRTLRNRIIGVDGIPLIPCEEDAGYTDDREESEDFEVARIVEAYQSPSDGVTLHYLCELVGHQGVWWISYDNLNAVESVEQFVGIYGCYSCRHKKRSSGCGNCDAQKRHAASLREQLKLTQGELKDVKAKLTAAEAKLKNFERLQQLNHPNAAAVQEGIAEAHGEVGELKQQLADLQKKIEEKDATIAAQKDRIEELETDVAALQHDNKILKQQTKDRDDVHSFMVQHASDMDHVIDGGVRGPKSVQELLSVTPTPLESDAIKKYMELRRADAKGDKNLDRVLYRLRQKQRKAQEKQKQPFY